MDDLTAVETQYRVPSGAKSCHTAVVGGYVVVGHVPADVIRRTRSGGKTPDSSV